MIWDFLNASVSVEWETKRLSLINRLGNRRSAERFGTPFVFYNESRKRRWFQ